MYPLRRWLNTATAFVSSSADVWFNLTIYSQWPIASREPKDEYGYPLGHPQCTIKAQRNYVDTDVPEEFHNESRALEYVEVLRMSFNEIMDMRYDEFVKVTLLHRAVTMRRPTRTADDLTYYNTFGKHRGQ